MRILVTGSAGYIGSLLVPFLLGDGHHVRGLDVGWFGDGFLPKENGHLENVTADIRDREAVKRAVRGMDAVIHLASISNDQACQLDEALSRSVNIDAVGPLLMAAKEAGVRRFIYASSSSAYGSSDAPQVTEEHPLSPLTLYSKGKVECERMLWEVQSQQFVCTAVRPATVCGYAPRQRFDLSLNMMVNHAVQRWEISVFGGEQMRSHIHIRDMVDCYRALLAAPAEKIGGRAFNVGHRNMRIRETAAMVAAAVAQAGLPWPKIKIEPRDDDRSYHIESSAIEAAIGFKAERPLEQAVQDLCGKFKQGMWQDSMSNPWFQNIAQYLGRHAA